MGVLVQIRDVDEAVRDELKSRAAAKGQSLNAYLRALLDASVRRPSRDQVLARIDGRLETAGVSSVDVIRAARESR